MKLYAKTDVGRKREINQDYVYVTDKPIGPFPNLSIRYQISFKLPFPPAPADTRKYHKCHKGSSDWL